MSTLRFVDGSTAVDLVLANDADVEEVAGNLGDVASIALVFPKWTDGRAYSQARLLRGRHRFGGEIRATGEVLVDMVPLLARCGFDAIQLRAGQSQEVAERALSFFPAGHYQGFVVTLSSASLVLQDGTRLTIEPPGGGWSARIRTAPFEVVDGEPTTVELSIRLGQALHWIRDHFEFEPIFGCHVGHGHGGDDGDDDSGPSGGDGRHGDD